MHSDPGAFTPLPPGAIFTADSDALPGCGAAPVRAMTAAENELLAGAMRNTKSRGPVSDPPPPQSLAEAAAHCRTQLERLAAGECFVPDAWAAVEAYVTAVRAATADEADSFAGGLEAGGDTAGARRLRHVADFIRTRPPREWPR